MEEEIIEILADTLGISSTKIGLYADLENELGADSLHFVEILMVIEEKYDIELDVDEQTMRNIRTVADIVKFIKASIGDNEVQQEEIALPKIEEDEQSNRQMTKKRPNKVTSEDNNSDNEQLSIFGLAN